MINQLTNGLFLITGGAWSGKTDFAQSLVSQTDQPVIWVGTGSRMDPAFSRHIDLIAQRRPPHWQTIEAANNLVLKLKEIALDPTPLVIDSLNQWLSNVAAFDSMKYSPDQMTDHLKLSCQEFLDALAPHLQQRPVILVTAETGWSVAPESPTAYSFRRCLGHLNQLLGQKSRQVTMVCSGIGSTIKPA